MTVIFAGDGQYRGLSTDTKPTAPEGFTFFETDTKDLLSSDGTFWWLITQGARSIKRLGRPPWSTGITTGTGMMNPVTAGTGAGTQNWTQDTTNGRYQNLITGAVAANKGGYRAALSSMLIRQFNPRIWIRFALTDTTLHNVYFGFASTGEPTGVDPLNAASGVFFGILDGTTNFSIMQNDGTGVTVISDAVTATAKDTAVHEIKIVCDEPNTRIAYKFDNTAYQYLTTDIPAATTGMTWMLSTETTTTAAKAVKLYSVFMQSDK